MTEGQNTEKYNNKSDAELWSRVQSGDMDALSVVYKKYYSDLYFYGLKCSGNKPLVEDSIQDLYIKLWNGRENISVKSIKPYLLTSLRRTLLDKLASRSEQMKPEDNIPENFAPELSVEDVTIKIELDQEKLDNLERGLKLLTSRQKEIIYLRFYQELSYDEIADMMDIKYQSVRNSVYESIKLIKNNLMDLVLLISTCALW